MKARKLTDLKVSDFVRVFTMASLIGIGPLLSFNWAYGQTSNTIINVDIRPLYVAANPNTNLIYVVAHSNRNDSTVKVIDGNEFSPNTDQVIAEIPLLDSAPSAIAVNSITNKIYVADKANDQVIEMDGDSNEIAGTVSVGRTPVDIAINPGLGAEGIVYVTNTNEDTVSVIDVATKQKTTFDVGDYPKGITVDPQTNLIYVVNEGDNTFTVHDGTTYAQVTPPIQLEGSPFDIAINRPDPDTCKIYITIEYFKSTPARDRIAVYHCEDYEFIVNKVVGNGPTFLAVDSDNNKIYATNSVAFTANIPSAHRYEDSVTKINGANDGVQDYIAVGDHSSSTDFYTAPLGIAFNSTTGKLYVAVRYLNTVEVIEP